MSQRDAKGVQGTTIPPIHKDMLENQANKKGKEVVVRQQLKRIVKEMSFLCQSPYLKDYKESRDRLKPKHMMLVGILFSH